MKNTKKIISSVLIGIFALGFSGCNLVSKTPEAIAKSTVATVNGEKITRGELDTSSLYLQQIAQMKAQNPNFEKDDSNKEQIKTLKSQVLEQMITEKIVIGQAKRLNINLTDPKIDEKVQKDLDDIKNNFLDDQKKFDQKKFDEALKQAGYTEKGLKQDIKNRNIQQEVYDKVTENVKIDDAKAKEYYGMNQMKYTEKPDMIKLAHILVKTEDEAKKVVERLKNGEDFGKLAKELSTDDGSKDKNGEYEVPYVGSGFDQTFMNTAIAQKEGEISKPIQTQFGFHVIKTIKKTEYPVKPFDTVKEEIKKTVEQDEKEKTFNAELEKWKKDAKTETKKYEKNLM